VTKRIFSSEFSLYWLVLLYLQFRWLPMERNTVYIRCNVGLTTLVTDTVLQVAMMLSTEGCVTITWRRLLLLQLSRQPRT